MDSEYGGKITEKSSDMELNDIAASNYSLLQVMKAVEAAEATIKQQVEENKRLRSELHTKSQDLEKLTKSYDHISDEGIQSVSHNIPFDYSPDYINLSMNRAERNSIARHHESQPINNNVNGGLKLLSNRPATSDNTGISHLSSPSTSFSPRSDHDPRSNVIGRGLIQVTDGSNSNWKQDKEYEEEIAQLRNYLAEFSKKEAQIRSENYALEKRISFMRLAFDQQQQDLVDAASKALSYRQDIIEENVRLTYELQAAQQERSTFVTSLLPLLADYSLQPPVPDAQSIISNVRILFKHLQEKLSHIESKLKDFEYRSLPWNKDVNASNQPGGFLSLSNADLSKGSLDLVPQSTFSTATVAVSSGDFHTATHWEFQRDYTSGLAGAITKNLETQGERYSPLGSRGIMIQDSPGQYTPSRDEMQDEVQAEVGVNFSKMVISSGSDASNANSNDRSMIASYPPSMNDQSSLYSPFLPPVLEEPTSSFSEAADDESLPGIRELQISGEAFPGRELQACGYSINGTTSCNFEWVRHLEDGSVNYIEGAKQPRYLVTADDVDAYLAIEVLPLDDRKRKGELVKVFANENRKIACDPDMQSVIEKSLYSGHASFKVSLSTGYLDIWEPATLSIKKESYSIKCSGPSGIVVNDKFSPSTNISIPYGQSTELIITTSSGSSHLLRDNLAGADSSRDLIVLTFRLFLIRANQRRKGKKRFFLIK